MVEFAIVEFTSETDQNGKNVIEIVPSFYVSGNQCFWPPPEKINYLKQSKPFNTNWPRYPCKIKRTFVSHQAAVDFLNVSRISSDEEDQPQQMLNEFTINDTNSTEDDDDDHTLTELRTVPSTSSAGQYLQNFQENDYSSNSSKGTCKCGEILQRLTSLEAKIDRLAGLESKIDLLLQMTQKEMRPKMVANQLPHFPFQRDEQLREFETKLADEKEVEQQFYQYCLKKAAKRPDIMVRSLLKSIKSTELASQYTWTGYGNKRAVQNLNFINIILRSVDDYFKGTSISEQNVSTIKEWYRNAAARNKIISKNTV